MTSYPASRTVIGASIGVAVVIGVSIYVWARTTDDGDVSRLTTSASARSWPGPHRTRGTSVISVAEFNDYLATARPPSARSPLLSAAEFLRLEEPDAATTSVAVVRKRPEDRRRATATVTLDGLLDDSIRSERYVLELERRADGTWRLRSARWTQRCWLGRGHQVFSPELCS